MRTEAEIGMFLPPPRDNLEPPEVKRGGRIIPWSTGGDTAPETSFQTRGLQNAGHLPVVLSHPICGGNENNSHHWLTLSILHGSTPSPIHLLSHSDACNLVPTNCTSQTPLCSGFLGFGLSLWPEIPQIFAGQLPTCTCRLG